MISATEYAHLSLRVYEPTPTHPAGGRYRIAQKQLPSGFFAATFFNKGTGAYVVAFRGTEPDDMGDVTADLDIARKTLPRQYPEAIAFAADTIGKPPKSYFWLGTPGAVYTVVKKGHFYYQQHSMANLAAAV